MPRQRGRLPSGKGPGQSQDTHGPPERMGQRVLGGAAEQEVGVGGLGPPPAQGTGQGQEGGKGNDRSGVSPPVLSAEEEAKLHGTVAAPTPSPSAKSSQVAAGGGAGQRPVGGGRDPGGRDSPGALRVRQRKAGQAFKPGHLAPDAGGQSHQPGSSHMLGDPEVLEA